MWMSVKDTSGREVLVNMALATRIVAANSKSALIEFDHENTPVIAEPLEQFKRRLAEVMTVAE